METTQGTLTHLANELQKEFNKSKDRASEWNARTKIKIENVLRALHNVFPFLDMYIQPSIVEGEQFVTLQLTPTAAVNNPKQFRRGGALTYSLTHRGKVLPVIVYPYVQGQVAQNPAFVIGGESIEPEAINKELIWSHVQTFLEEMSRWETGNIVPVGFKMDGDKLAFTDEPITEK